MQTSYRYKRRVTHAVFGHPGNTETERCQILWLEQDKFRLASAAENAW
ncbi:hypothetical protein [Yersinia aldovae]|nr:hypothetical protein [Yersinia aldovae]EEP95851.1 hypothetical protein yaldo0001_18050 [Yersinia aldovae ATCC 35236]